MNLTALCFGYNKTVYDYLATPTFPENERTFPKKSWKRFRRRLNRRFLRHKIKRYAYAKKELFLWGKVRGRVVYDTICAPNPNKKGYIRRWSEPSYRVNAAGKIIERF